MTGRSSRRRVAPSVRGLGRVVGLRGRLLSTMVAAALASVAIAGFGVEQMSRLAGGTRAAFVMGTVPADALRTLQGTWWEYQAHVAAAQVVGATPDEVAAERFAADRVEDVLVGQQDVVRAAGLTSGAQPPFEEFVALATAYLAWEESRSGAAVGQVDPSERVQAATTREAASAALQRATSEQVRSAASASMAAQQGFRSARRDTVLLLAAALLATLGVTTAVTTSVTRPLAQIRRSLAHAGGGAPGPDGRRSDDLLVGLAADIELVHRARLSGELVRRTVEALPSAVIRVDATGAVVFANRRAGALLGITAGAGPQEQAAHLTAADRTAYTALLRAAVHEEATHPSRLQVALRPDRGPATPEQHLTVVFVPLGDLRGTSGATVSFTDVTESVLRQEALRERAQLDGLTGCLNRSALEDHLAAALATGAPTTVVFLDVDHFKPINDELGHAAGDEVLRWIGTAVRQTLRPSDVVGRVGGDEFVVVLDGSLATHDRLALVARMRDAVEQTVPVAGSSVAVGVSLGAVTVTAAEQGSAADVLAQADAAMYKDKRSRTVGRRSPQGAVATAR